MTSKNLFFFLIYFFFIFSCSKPPAVARVKKPPVTLQLKAKNDTSKKDDTSKDEGTDDKKTDDKKTDDKKDETPKEVHTTPLSGLQLVSLPLDEKPKKAANKLTLPNCSTKQGSTALMYDEDYTEVKDKFYVLIEKDPNAVDTKKMYLKVAHDVKDSTNKFTFNEASTVESYNKNVVFDDVIALPAYYFFILRLKDQMLGALWIDRDKKLFFKKQDSHLLWSKEKVQLAENVSVSILSLDENCGAQIFYKTGSDMYNRSLKPEALVSWNNTASWTEAQHTPADKIQIGWAYYNEYLAMGGISIEMPKILKDQYPSTISNTNNSDFFSNFFKINIPRLDVQHLLILTLWNNGLEKNLLSGNASNEATSPTNDKKLALDLTGEESITKNTFNQELWEKSLKDSAIAAGIKKSLWDVGIKDYIYTKGLAAGLWDASSRDTLWQTGLKANFWGGGGLKLSDPWEEGFKVGLWEKGLRDAVWAAGLKEGFWEKGLRDAVWEEGLKNSTYEQGMKNPSEQSGDAIKGGFEDMGDSIESGF